MSEEYIEIDGITWRRWACKHCGNTETYEGVIEAARHQITALCMGCRRISVGFPCLIFLQENEAGKLEVYYPLADRIIYTPLRPDSHN